MEEPPSSDLSEPEPIQKKLINLIANSFIYHYGEGVLSCLNFR
ncbi:hypothetical protein [Entomomonas asaccharolytica]|nr:hypothetical protein [Entomomonas asaccharolytica]